MIRDAIRRAVLVVASLATVATLPATAAAETADEFVERLNRQSKNLALEWHAARLARRAEQGPALRLVRIR